MSLHIMTDTLIISLLGSPRITLNGRLLQFPSIKATALLAYLATSGMLHDRGELAALLWPESDNKRARGALRYTLSLLKKELGDEFLLINRRQIGLNPQADCTADIVTIRYLLAPALEPNGELTHEQLPDLEKGVALYQADFLQGFSLRDSDNFNQWAFIQAEALRRDLATVLQRLTAVYQAQQQWTTAISHAHRWLNLDPLHEPAHCQLMQLYAAAGEWTAVHNQYQSLIDLLEVELNTTPQTETAVLYQSLQQQRPTPPPTAITNASPDQRSRHVLIEKIRRFWVNSLLTPLHDQQNYIPLRLQTQATSTLIDHPWADVLSDGQLQPTSSNISHAFQQADRALLILGAPGAGKTITLIELAADLLNRASQDKTVPVPVILNLSGWAEKETDIAEWAIEEMVAKYQIPRRMGRNWLKNDRLLFLLDGLDEMPADSRAASIRAINSYRQTHGLADVVVCCREEVYETAVQQHNTRLQLNSAICIQPLSTGQIRQHTPPHLATTLFQDALLLEMAQSPLNLNMLQMAFFNNKKGEKATSDTPPTITHHNLFQQYTQRMFQRQADKETVPYTLDELSQQLVWLARQMQQHNQSIFLIEQLQPSWLANGRSRWRYLFWAHTIMPAFLGMFIMWSFIQLIGVNPPYIKLNFLAQFAAALFGLTITPWNELFSLFCLNLLAGILSSIVTGLFFIWRRQRGDAARIDSRLGWLQLLIVAGVAGTAVTLPIALTDDLTIALFQGSMAAFGLALTFGGLNYGQSFRTEIRLRGALKWSWAKALRLGAIGATLSLIWSGVIWLRDPTAFAGMINLLNMGLLFFLLGGLNDKQPESRSRPNEGMRVAGRNGLQASLVVALPAMLLTAVTVNPISGLHTGIMLGIFAGTVHGFNDVIKHTILRLLLWRKQQIPLRYATLLDCAADCVLLQKVGGGYTFRHRLLLDYFANTVSFDDLPPPPSPTQPTPIKTNAPLPMT